MSTATSLLDSPAGAEQLVRLIASPAALSVLSGNTAAEGTGLIDMADSDDGRDGADLTAAAPTRRPTRN